MAPLFIHGSATCLKIDLEGKINNCSLCTDRYINISDTGIVLWKRNPGARLARLALHWNFTTSLFQPVVHVLVWHQQSRVKIICKTQIQESPFSMSDAPWERSNSIDVHKRLSNCPSHLAPENPGLQEQLPPESPPTQTPSLKHLVFASHATGGKRHLLDKQIQHL